MSLFADSWTSPARRWSAAAGRRLSRKQKDARRRHIVQRDGADCFYCLQPLGDDVTLEHLVEKVRGGGHHPDNLVLTHARCNEAVCRLSLAAKLLRRGDVLLAHLAGEDLTPWDGRLQMGGSQLVELRRQIAAFGAAA